MAPVPGISLCLMIFISLYVYVITTKNLHVNVDFLNLKSMQTRERSIHLQVVL